MASKVKLICIALSLMNLVSSATIKHQSMYDKIIEKCSYLKEDTKYRDQPFLKYCDNWTSIEKATDQTSILCLIYYDTFVNYCTQTKHVNITVSADTRTATLDYVCQQLTNIPKSIKFEHESVMSKINLEECNSICNADLGMAKSICILSAFNFLHIKLPENKIEKAQKAIEHLPEIPKSIENNKQEQKQETEEHKELIAAVDVAKDLTTPKQLSSIEMSSVKNEQQSHIQKEIEIAIESKSKPNSDIKPHDPIQESKLPTSSVTKVTLTNINKVSTEEITASASAANKPNVPEPESNIQIPKSNDMEQEKIQIEQSLNNNQADEENPYIQSQSDNINIDDDNKGKKNEETDDANDDANVNVAEVQSEVLKPHTLDESVNYNTEIDGDSYFFSYFMILCCIFIIGYIGYHNKQKILALILEGRRGKRQYRNRRPNSANYHKLDSNLEEAISSSCTKDASNVIY